MNRILFFAFLLSSCFSMAQNNYIVHRKTNSKVELKWYTSDLIVKKPMNVYRKIGNGNWEKINSQAIELGKYKFTASEQNKDKDLKKYTDLAKSDEKLEGLGLLIATLKSFESIPFSKFLGIYFSDDVAGLSGNVQYRVTYLDGGSEKDLAISEKIGTGNLTKKPEVDSLNYKLKRKGVDFAWKPEPLKYYGVDIYRSLDAKKLGEKITKDPVIISKVKNEKGEEAYPESFFSDNKLKEKETYYYTFVGLDFFGDEIKYSDKVKVRIKDETLPEAPINLNKVISDKTIRLTWNKTIEEEDFSGYRVYVYTPDDSTLKLQNATTLSFVDSSFQIDVPEYGLYFVKVAAVDDEENEGFSAELVADVLDKIPPAAPIGVRIISDTGRLIITWTQNTEPDILGYKIYRTVKGDYNNLSLLTADAFSKNEFVDSLPKNALNSFGYAILALDTSLNESALSEMASNTLVDVLPPKVPFLKRIRQEQDKVVLEWVKNTEFDLAGYNVFRKNESDPLAEFRQINVKTLPGDVGKFYDRRIKFGDQYVYHIKAVDIRNNTSIASNPLRVKTKSNVVAEPVELKFTKLKYNKQTNSLRINWKTSIESEEYSFVVFKRNTKGEFKVVSPRGKDYSFKDNDLKRGEKAEYQVRLYDARGKITRSEVKTIKIPNKKNKTK